MSKNYLFQEIIVKNPVLIGTIGLCPIVAICTSLKAALIMSAVTILTLIVAQALSSLVLRHLPQWLRMGLYMLVGMFVVVPFILLVEKVDSTTMLALGIYLPLLAVNPVIVRQCEREGVNIGLAESFINSLCAGFGYSAVLIIVGIVREIFGNGTIWGVQILPITPAAGMLMPMGGFVVLAFMAALLRTYFRKIDPAYAEELAVNSRTAIKGHRGLKALLIDSEDEPETGEVPIEKEIPAVVETAPVAEFVSKETKPLTTDDEIDQLLKEVVSENGENNTKKSAEILNEVPTEVPADTPIGPKDEANTIFDAEFAEESAPNMTVAEKTPDAKKSQSGSLFGKFGKKSEKPEKKAGKKKRAKSSPAPAATPKSEVPPAAEAQKPKYEFITLELPSAVKKAEEKAVAERAALSKAEAERAADENAAAEKARLEAEKEAREKTIEKKTAAEKRAKKAMDEARKTASQLSDTTAFAAPVSEEEAKAETSTAKRNHSSNIVYRSEELERLMSMSLDDILNGLPSGNGDGEEGEK